MKKFFQIVVPIAFCAAIVSACNKPTNINYRNEMRAFVEKISVYSKNIKPGFIIIPQNGQELLTADGTGAGSVESEYINAIDGQAREDIYYGYDADNTATPSDVISMWEQSLDVLKNNGKQVLCIDYCSTPSKMDDAYSKNAAKHYISFSADQRNLNNIPTHAVYNENSSDINTLNDAQNFLYLINPENYSTKTQMIDAIKNTNYDAIVMDLYFNDELLSTTDVDQLKTKLNGGKRLVICYMSIGEAEDYRFYWQQKWKTQKPAWLGKVNPQWKGNYKVEYWNQDWQNIITGNDNSYNKKILDAGFDGVYLDIIDAFEYYEN